MTGPLPFRKLDINYLEQKVNPYTTLFILNEIYLDVQVSERWKVCGNLGKILSSQDPVLEQWQENVERLHSNMSVLQLLVSRSLQITQQ